jgi:hypothetical protein
VTKPKPFSSLNHFTVPVAMGPPTIRVLLTREVLQGNHCERWHYLRRER